MIKLRAIAAGDGWGIVEDKDDLLLVKPPYHKDRLIKVTTGELASAVVRHGFTATEKTFNGWPDLIDFLMDEMIRARRELGQKIEAEKIPDLFNYATPEILRRYLDRIETELLPNKEYRAARAILRRLLQLDKLRQDPSLKEKAKTLLKDCEANEPHPEKILLSENVIKVQFPHAAKRLSPAGIIKKAESVASSGQLLALGR